MNAIAPHAAMNAVAPVVTRYDTMPTEPAGMLFRLAEMGPGVLYGQSAAVCRFVEAQLGDGTQFPSNAPALGVMLDGRLIAGVVYTHYTGANMELSCAATSPRWLVRSVLRHVFAYPFTMLACRRVTAITRASKTDVQRFLIRLGFTHECVMEAAYPTEDAVMFKLLRADCRWIEEAP